MVSVPPTHLGLHLLHKVVVASGVLLSSSAVQGQCPTRYSVDLIPGPDCRFVYSSSVGIGISPTGEICGEWSDCNHLGHGAIWPGQGGWMTIPLPTGISSIGPRDINTARHVAAMVPGSSNPNLDRAAFVDFPTGTVTIIGGLPGSNNSYANAISENSIVCGYSFNSATGNPPYQAFTWQSGQMSRLTLPLGPDSVANDISDSGSVCGWMGESHLTAHAFLWSDGDAVDLGVIPGGQSAAAYGISNNGKVCGTGILPAAGGKGLTRHAFYWSDGVMSDLGVLPIPGHDRSIAYSVNDDGIVIGHSSNQVLVGDAFVWQNGVMRALDDLIPSSLNLHIDIVWSINNAGQIAGLAEVLDNSGDEVAVRLTPIPPTPGDYNCDDVVNIDDLLGVITHWGPAPPGSLNAAADLNQDGVVNIDDLLIVITNWS